MKLYNLRAARGYLLLILAGFLFLYNFSIVQKERFLTNGTPLVLALAPIDPRSLMQGDYMILDFALESEILAAERHRYSDRSQYPREGAAVLVRKEKEHVFSRLYDGESLGEGEFLLKYKREGRNIKIGGGSFFFEEGLDGLYDHARYAVVRVDKNGKAMISGLLDLDGKELNKSRWDAENRRLVN